MKTTGYNWQPNLRRILQSNSRTFINKSGLGFKHNCCIQASTTIVASVGFVQQGAVCDHLMRWQTMHFICIVGAVCILPSLNYLENPKLNPW